MNMVPHNEYTLKTVLLTTVNNILLECEKNPLDFLDGPVVESLPADAGDTGSIPCPRGSHMRQSS